MNFCQAARHFAERSIALLATLLLFAAPASAASGDWVAGQHSRARLLSGRYDGQSWLALDIHLDDGWHTYWQNPGDTGMAATLSAVSPADLPLEPHWPLPARLDTDGLVSFVYDDRLLLPIRLFTAPPGTIRLHAEWLVCREQCIPEQADLSVVASGDDLTLEPGFVEALSAAPSGPVIAARIDRTADDITVMLPPGNAPNEVFPLTPGSVALTPEPEIESGQAATHIRFRPGISTFGSSLELAARIDGAARRIVATPDASTAVDSALADTPFLGWLIGSAFLGGLLLNLMPCVLPVLSLKLLSFVRQHPSKRTALTHGAAYALGIECCLLALAGTLLALRSAGASLGWGFQLQSPIFVAAVCTLVFAVGLNLSGLLPLGALFGNAHRQAESRGSLTGSFFAGLLVVLVATPCSAPFMAGAVGSALLLPAASALAVFAALGLGLAAPLLLVTLIPSLSSRLPRPGHWMLTLKHGLALPMYATAAWLLWLLAREAGTDALAVGLVLLLLTASFAWLTGLGCSRFVRVGLLLVYLCTATALVLRIPSSTPQTTTAVEGLQKLSAPIDRKLLVDVTADWCLTCKLNARILQSAETAALLESRGIERLTLDWTSGNPQLTAYLARFGRSGVPMDVYYAPGKRPILLPPILTPRTVEEATR